jgi:hypothetical protein
MNPLPLGVRARHLLIRSRWQRWWFPALCVIPYGACLVWLLGRGLFWVAQVMLAPVVMGGAMAVLTLWLARQEFRTRRARR